jgi:hypothetical protein
MTRLAIVVLVVTGVLGAIGCWFAADRAPGGVPFDGKRAMGYLEDVCKIGPRISGTDGMKKQQELLQKHFEAHGATIEMQPFQAKQHSKPRPIAMANMIVSWFPDRPRRVIICSHYDTRPIADQEEQRRDWFKPFISANDGGSGVALLMELGHHMKELRTQVGVDFVFFDGEEHIFDVNAGDKYFFGSEHFAQTYKKEKPKHTYIAAVLLDMIAGKEPAFPKEGHSSWLAGPLQEELWKIAAEQGCGAFKDRMGASVQDDHLALNRIARIPTVDIIDFDYPHWHRLTDVPACCSADGMNQVARVLSVWLQRVK